MTLGISDRNKIAASTGRKNDIDAAAVAGSIEYYPAPRAAKGAAPGVTLLCAMTLNYPCGTVDAAGLHLTSSTPAQAVAAGIIKWARIKDGAGNFVMDADVRMLTDSDVAIADMIIDVAQVYVGSFITLVAATLAEGG